MTSISVDTRISSAIGEQNNSILSLVLSANDMAYNLADKIKGFNPLITLLDGFNQSHLGSVAASDMAQLLQQVTTNAMALAEELQEALDTALSTARSQGHLLEAITVVANAKAMLHAEQVEGSPPCPTHPTTAEAVTAS